ncbi:MAG: polysaccharide biosynthesis/export family protein [Opitutales bacterium]
MKTNVLLFLTGLSFVLTPVSNIGVLRGAEAANAQEPILNETPDSYQLSIRDLIQIGVFNEPAMTTDQRIDGAGQIRVPLLGPVRIAGRGVREVESLIEDLYIEEEIFINPQVTLRVQEYAPKEVSVLGEVNNKGRIPFPIEANTMDIIEVISKANGFTALARATHVQITRTGPDGQDQTYELNVERMIDGRRRRGQQESIPIFPGDIIYVPQRFW